MKKKDACLIIGVILVVIGVIIVFVEKGKENKDGGLFSFNKSIVITSDTPVVTGTKMLDKFESLSVDTSFINVVFEEGNEWKLDYSVYEGFEPEVSSGSSTTIKQPGRNEGISLNINWGFNSKPIYYKITVPKDYKGNIEFTTSSGDISASVGELTGNIKTSSGNAMVKDCTLKGEIGTSSGNVSVKDAEVIGEISTSSGDVMIENAEFDGNIATSSGDVEAEDSKINGSIKTVSGTVELEEIEGTELSVDSSSGDLKSNDIRYDKVVLTHVSGETKIENSKIKKIESSSSSGDFKCKADGAEEIKVQTVSGEVEVETDGKAEDYTIKASSVSGSIKIGSTSSEKKYESQGNTNKSISIKTSSGDIKVKF